MKQDRILMTLFLIAAIVSAADILTTLLCMGSGLGLEGNPLAVLTFGLGIPIFVVMVVVKAEGLVLIFVATDIIPYERLVKPTRYASYSLLIILTSIIVYSNTLIACGHIGLLG